MKYYQTSALAGTHVESMFFGIIEDIVIMQQARRKRIGEDDDIDLIPPLTTDKINSHRLHNRENQQSEEQTEDEKVKLTNRAGWRRFCCLG